MNDETGPKKIVEDILRRALAPLGLSNLEIADSLDHDGDPVILAIANYGIEAPKLDPRRLLDAIVEAQNALSAAGDSRSVLVQNFFADGEAVPDDLAPKSPNLRRKTIAR
jgi:hypothetical protein